MHNTLRIFRILLLFVMLLAAACDNDSPATSTAVPATQAPTPEAASEIPSATPEVTAEEETEEIVAPTPTEEVIDVGEPIEVTFVTREGEEATNFADQTGEYSAMINLISLENFNEALADPPAGFKWVQVDATLANESAAAPIEVTQESLFLVDSEGNRYTPEETDEFVSPPLVGQTIETGEFFRGFARFAIPEDATPAHIEWCLDTACNQIIQAKANFR